MVFVIQYIESIKVLLKENNISRLNILMVELTLIECAFFLQLHGITTNNSMCITL